MSSTYKIRVMFNLANVSKGINTFVWQANSILPPTDSQVLSESLDWITAIYAPIRPLMDSNVTVMSCFVDELVESTGKVLRHVGSISPAVNGSLAQNALPFIDTGSAFARTNIPKVRGLKSFLGFTILHMVDGLYTNPLLSALTAATVAWLNGPSLSVARAGVWSSKVNDFVPFINQGGTTNIPGSRVTRKPGRGL